MLVWVILPPNFDATKKVSNTFILPGGPQRLTQFYSVEFSANGR
jgi:dipeptidyl aminopeptidase/acylaminoacyl peptidase